MCTFSLKIVFNMCSLIDAFVDTCMDVGIQNIIARYVLCGVCTKQSHLLHI